MSGSNKQTTKTNQSQTSQTSMGSTPAASAALTGFTNATNNALNAGEYSGDVVAAPTQLDQYAPFLGDISGTVADPGQALDRYTPNVNVLDNYIAGETGTSAQGLASATGAATGAAPTVGDTSNNLLSYWNDVSSGRYLDPSQNTALQNYLNTLVSSSRQAQDQALAANRSAAISAGAYGGTGDARTNTWTNDQYDKNLQATEASMLYQNYMDEQARIAQAAQGTTDAFNLGQLPGQTLISLGNTQQGYDQQAINNQIAREQETERAQSNDIQSQIAQRQDTALRNQALLDNQRGLAQWAQAQQAAQIQDATLRAQVDQAIRQAGLTNDQSRYNAQTFGPMDIYQQYFNTLSNPVFGENSSGTATGTSTTTQSTPAWSQILGGLSAVGQTYGALTGNPIASAISAAGSAGQQPAMPTGYTPFQMPQIDYSQYFSNLQAPGTQSVPWYMQPAYAPGG